MNCLTYHLPARWRHPDDRGVDDRGGEYAPETLRERRLDSAAVPFVRHAGIRNSSAVVETLTAGVAGGVLSLGGGECGGEKRRFLREVQRLWNVHRFRLAAAVADRLEGLRAAAVSAT